MKARLIQFEEPFFKFCMLTALFFRAEWLILSVEDLCSSLINVQTIADFFQDFKLSYRLLCETQNVLTVRRETAGWIYILFTLVDIHHFSGFWDFLTKSDRNFVVCSTSGS